MLPCPTEKANGLSSWRGVADPWPGSNRHKLLVSSHGDPRGCPCSSRGRRRGSVPRFHLHHGRRRAAGQEDRSHGDAIRASRNGPRSRGGRYRSQPFPAKALPVRVPLLLAWSVPKKCASLPACLNSPICCPRQSGADRIGRHAGKQCVVLMPKVSGPIRGPFGSNSPYGHHTSHSAVVGMVRSMRTSAFSQPAQARALGHGQSTARLARPRRTGLSWTYSM